MEEEGGGRRRRREGGRKGGKKMEISRVDCFVEWRKEEGREEGRGG